MRASKAMPDPGVLYKRQQDCPDVSSHTPAPHGYIARPEWMERMAKTHSQRQCPTCGLWAVWVPKAKS